MSEKVITSESELYNHIVEMLSNGNFLQLNGKAINLTELNEYINAQQEEIERLKEENYELYLQCKQYEDKEEDLENKIERLNNIINIILDFNLFKDECPLCLGYLEKCDEEKAQDVFYEEEYCENCSDDYKKCWLKYFNRLQEFKGVDKE